jgi:ferredoxin
MLVMVKGLASAGEYNSSGESMLCGCGVGVWCGACRTPVLRGVRGAVANEPDATEDKDVVKIE